MEKEFGSSVVNLCAREDLFLWDIGEENFFSQSDFFLKIIKNILSNPNVKREIQKKSKSFFFQRKEGSLNFGTHSGNIGK